MSSLICHLDSRDNIGLVQSSRVKLRHEEVQLKSKIVMLTKINQSEDITCETNSFLEPTLIEM